MNFTYSIMKKFKVIYIDYYCDPSAGVRNAASVSINTDGSIKIVSKNRFYEVGFAVSYCIN